jgi:hypothetical protein
MPDPAWSTQTVLDGKSSDDAAIGLVCSGRGNNSFPILRRTGCRVGLNPKTNSQIRRSDELDSRVLEDLANLFDGIKVGLDTTFRALQPAYGRKRQPRKPGKLVLPPSEERACCLNLSRVNEHLRLLIPSGSHCEFQSAGPRPVRKQVPYQSSSVVAKSIGCGPKSNERRTCERSRFQPHSPHVSLGDAAKRKLHRSRRKALPRPFVAGRDIRPQLESWEEMPRLRHAL